MAVRPFDEIFRDFVINGLPASGLHHPEKKDIRDSLNALVAGPFPDNRVIKLNNANEGTENNIVVSASAAIPTAVYQVLYILNVTQENTGPVTVSGAINRKLVTNTNEPVPAGYLKPGMAVLCVDTGSELRMLSYGDVEKAVEDLVSRAEAAEAAAELAKDQAQNAASDAVSQGNVPIYSTRNAVETLEIPAGINAFRTNGFATVGDGGAALYKKVGSEPSHAGKVQSADGAWWEEVASQGTLIWYRTVHIPITQTVVDVTGHAIAVDGGAGRYIHSPTEPVHEAKFQDAGGRWFEFADRKIRVQHIQATAGLSGFDVTEAVQKALDYLEVRGGGELSIIPGTYDVSDIIRIPSKVKIVGEEGATFNRVSNTSSVLINKSGGSVGGYDANHNISISGLAIECNGATYTTPCTPVAFGHARKISIKNTWIRNVPGGWHAIELCAVSGAKIKGCTLDGGGNDLDTGEAIQLDIMGSEFGFPWFGPYDHMWCENVVIEDVTITNWAVGIGSHSVSSTPGGRHTNVKIRDCRINVSRHGITPYGWTRVSIKDNIITNYMRSDTTAGKNSIGINVTSTANNNCTAIRIRDNIIDGFERGGTAENSRGIAVAGPSGGAYTRQVSISGNFISNVKRHGIGVDYAQDVLVFGNRLEGIGQVGIYMFGSTKSSVRDNRVISGGAGFDDIIVNHGALPVGTLLDVIVSGNYCPRKMTANGTRIIVVDNIVGITTGSIDGSIINGTKAGNLVNGAWV